MDSGLYFEYLMLWSKLISLLRVWKDRKYVFLNNELNVTEGKRSEECDLIAAENMG